ncbi:MAG: precorrin-6y C5,15-methyltransferase (decarboxylating) subunit CbiE [Spirochaetia bacterium]|nr:precorrin-6y C5,15-methyltransferase (decarboxylating) subunit CbiE [Spirochaetia bacterium]
MGGKRIAIGCGPGAPDMITVRGQNAIEGAKVIAGSKKLLETFATDKECEKIEITGSYADVLDGIEEKHKNRDAVFLVSGDPLFFSLGEVLLKRYEKERLEFIPGISAMQYAASLEKKSWKNLRTITLHGAEKRYDNAAENVSKEFIKELLEKEEGFVIYLDKNNNLGYVKILLEGLDTSSHEFFIASNLSVENEVCRKIELDKFDKEPEESLSVLIVRRN